MLTLAGAGVLLVAAAALVVPGRVSRSRLLDTSARHAGIATVVPSLVAWWQADTDPRWAARAGWVLGAVAATAGLVMAGPVAALLAGCGASCGARAVQRLRHQRRATRARAEMLEAISVLVGELRAGRHPVSSLQIAADAAPVLLPAATTAAWGGDVAETLRPSGTPVADGRADQVGFAEHAQRALAAGWLLAERSGSGLAAVLGSVEADLRAAAALSAETAAELAGSRATVRVLAGLPLLGVLMGAALGARPVHVLLHTPVGAACTLAGLALEYAGLRWTNRLVAGATLGVVR